MYEPPVSLLLRRNTRCFTPAFCVAMVWLPSSRPIHAEHDCYYNALCGACNEKAKKYLML